jgi:hypothetical protein
MYYMRKVGFLILATLGIAGITVVNVNLNSQNDSSAVIYSANMEALAGEGGSGSCKWRLTDCPGWGTGDYEACLDNGDGNSCTCGNTSRNCPN